MKQHLLSTGTKRLADASLFDLVWGIGLWVDDPEARIPHRWPGKPLLGKALSTVREASRISEVGLASRASFQQFCTPTSPGGIHEISPSTPRPLALVRACLGPLSEFLACFLTRQRTAAPRSWLSRLGSTPPSRCQNMAPASSVVSLLSTTLLSPRRSRSTVELTSSRPMVAWRSLTLVPLRPSSDATYWIACSWWGQHPLRASGNALLILGVVLANLPLCKLRRASA